MKRLWITFVCFLILLAGISDPRKQAVVSVSARMESNAIIPIQSCGQATGFVLPVIDDNFNDNLTWDVPFNYFGNYYGSLGGYHPGEDWNLVGGSPNADLGKPVYAIADGTVAKVSNRNSLGYLVAIRHIGTFTIPAKSSTENGQSYSYGTETVTSIYSIYLHINNLPTTVYEGACVRKGQSVLGYIMNPGGGPHLHFEIRHPDTIQTNSWSLFGSQSNWAQVGGDYTGYYFNLQGMVNVNVQRGINGGVRDPREFIRANNCGNGSSENFRNPATGGAPVHPNGTLIKVANNGTVYLIQNGQRRWVSSPEVLRALYQNGGFDFKDVITVAADELSSYSVGANITGTLSGNGRGQPEGGLIRQQGQGEISIVTNNGMRRAFPNANIFLSLGYLFCNVVEVFDYYSYPSSTAVDGISLGSGGGGGGTGGVTALSNGQSISANVAQGEQKNYRINLPSGVTKLTVQITGSGDADLHVKYGSQATLNNYDCRPYLGSSNEQCVHNNPSDGDWYVIINGYSGASYTLTATYQTGSNSSNAPCTSCTLYTSSLANTGASNQQPSGSYYYSGISGTHNGWLRGPAGADFDLSLFKWNGSAWDRVAVSENATENEEISYTGTSGYYTWLINSYSGSGNYSFWLQRPQ